MNKKLKKWQFALKFTCLHMGFLSISALLGLGLAQIPSIKSWLLETDGHRVLLFSIPLIATVAYSIILVIVSLIVAYKAYKRKGGYEKILNFLVRRLERVVYVAYFGAIYAVLLYMFSIAQMVVEKGF